jgi:hypothetical protein
LIHEKWTVVLQKRPSIFPDATTFMEKIVQYKQGIAPKWIRQSPSRAHCWRLLPDIIYEDNWPDLIARPAGGQIAVPRNAHPDSRAEI